MFQTLDKKESITDNISNSCESRTYSYLSNIAVYSNFISYNETLQVWKNGITSMFQNYIIQYWNTKHKTDVSDLQDITLTGVCVKSRPKIFISRNELFLTLWLVVVTLLFSAFVVPVSSSECGSCKGVPCQKITGVFTRRILPIGYNVIATIPARACNITVRELSNSKNYLALRSNQRYIINGNWDVVPSGRYMGAGTGFYYRHPVTTLGSLPPVAKESHLQSIDDLLSTSEEYGEIIESPGPLTQQLQLMIIYQDINYGVNYEYWRPLLSNDLNIESSGQNFPTYFESEDQSRLSDDPIHSGQREVWKNQQAKSATHNSNFRSPILIPISRGQQRLPFHSANKYNRFTENLDQAQRRTPTGRRNSNRNNDRNINPNFRDRKRKNQRNKPFLVLQNIQPAYSSLPNYLNRVNINQNQQPIFTNNENLHLNPSIISGITNDYMGNNYETLLIRRYANENNVSEIMFPAWKVWQFTPCSRSCGGGEQQAVYICTSIGGHVVSEVMCGGESSKPQAQTMECNTRPCSPQWQLSDWSPCSVTCGAGLQSRTWACIQVVNPSLTQAVSPTLCPMPSVTHVPLTKPCNIGDCTRWNVHIWSQCSVDCGTGIRTREVQCLVESATITTLLPDSVCNVQEKPPYQMLCHASKCLRNTWFFTEWSDQCIGGCENGRQYRKVWCSSEAHSPGGRNYCPGQTKPPAQRACGTDASCAALWFSGPWTQCSGKCGGGNRTREVVCVVFLRGSFRATLDLECDSRSRPSATEQCNTDPCPPHWYFTQWTPCSRSCGRGSQQRSVQCLDTNQHPSLECIIASRPSRTKTCSLTKCRHRLLSGDDPRDHYPSRAEHQRMSSSSRNCQDRFRNCSLVQQARLCRYTYYATVCCASCHGWTLAHG
uniref:Thrombospondin type-1 domain-containing protein 4-like n=1 Tax=Hirondellea gigas TaxID=1518452 RepID=A0A2P2I461_9CRUS